MYLSAVEIQIGVYTRIALGIRGGRVNIKLAAALGSNMKLTAGIGRLNSHRLIIRKGYRIISDKMNGKDSLGCNRA